MYNQMQNCHNKRTIQLEEGCCHQNIGLTLKEETSKVLHLEHSFLCCWNWTLRKVDQKYLEGFVVWCWKRMEIIWNDRVRNEEVLQRVNEDRNSLYRIKRRKANWIDRILRKNCLLKHVIEGKKVEERI
jgi:hypothetical protein